MKGFQISNIFYILYDLKSTIQNQAPIFFKFYYKYLITKYGFFLNQEQNEEEKNLNNNSHQLYDVWTTLFSTKTEYINHFKYFFSLPLFQSFLISKEWFDSPNDQDHIKNNYHTFNPLLRSFFIFIIAFDLVCVFHNVYNVNPMGNIYSWSFNDKTIIIESLNFNFNHDQEIGFYNYLFNSTTTTIIDIIREFTCSVLKIFTYYIVNWKLTNDISWFCNNPTLQIKNFLQTQIAIPELIEHFIVYLKAHKEKWVYGIQEDTSLLTKQYSKAARTLTIYYSNSLEITWNNDVGTDRWAQNTILKSQCLKDNSNYINFIDQYSILYHNIPDNFNFFIKGTSEEDLVEIAKALKLENTINFNDLTKLSDEFNNLNNLDQEETKEEHNNLNNNLENLIDSSHKNDKNDITDNNKPNNNNDKDNHYSFLWTCLKYIGYATVVIAPLVCVGTNIIK